MLDAFRGQWVVFAGASNLILSASLFANMEGGHHFPDLLTSMLDQSGLVALPVKSSRLARRQGRPHGSGPPCSAAANGLAPTAAKGGLGRRVTLGAVSPPVGVNYVGLHLRSILCGAAPTSVR